MSLDTVKTRSNTAAAALFAAHREGKHWLIQAAYTRIRALFPAATWIYVDVPRAMYAPARITEVVALEAGARKTLYQRPHRHDLAQSDLCDVEVTMGLLLSYCKPHLLPGWLETGASSRYEVELDLVPPALDVDRGTRDRFGLFPGPTGLVAIVAAALESYQPAAREYARAVVEGRLRPLTAIEQWPCVPAALGHTVALDDSPAVANPDLDQLDQDEWQSGIAIVHGLAAGVVWCPNDAGSALGTHSLLRERVGVYPEDLAEAGITLQEFAAAFGDDVRAAAVAVMQAYPNA
jgi:hypothetical protein